jgi:hypothetical protein
MNHKTLIALGSALCITLSGGAIAAAGHDHGHQHGAAPAKLQLNAGKKWETDAPLRQSMGNIRQAMADALHAIHDNKLSSQGYAALAKKVEDEVGQMVANCQLGTEADAQLHIVIEQLLGGAERMAGKVKSAKRRDGAVRVIGALDKYAKFFDDAAFKPIEH